VYPTGNVPIIGLDFPETPPHRALAAEAQVELGEAGIPVTLRPHSPDQYESLVSSGRAEVFVLTIAGTALTPSAFLTPQFVSGNPANVTGLSSSRVDEAVRAADAERKPAAREQDYATAEREVLDQFVLLPIVQLDDRLLVGPRVRGLEVSPLGAIDALTVRVHGSPNRGKKGGR
jgi:ABC-type oligopeptide transport system substrate-binding subunit